MEKIALKIAGWLFMAVALAHVLRLVLNVTVSVNGTLLPLWISAPAAVVMAALAWWMFRAGGGCT